MIEGAVCSRCGGELFSGEYAGWEYNKYGEGKVLCRDCVREEIESLPDDELFEMCGFEPEKVLSAKEAREEALAERADLEWNDR